MIRVDRLTAIGSDTVRQAVSWWLGELRGLLAGRFAVRAEHAPAILDVSHDRETLLLAPRGAAPLCELPLRGIDPRQAREQVQAAMRGRGLGDAVVIRLDRSVLMQTSVMLPLAAEHRLGPILQNQLERLVPLPPAEICFQHRVSSRSPEAKTLKAELVIARRATIEHAVALARSLGLVPGAAIAAAGADAAGHNAALVLWRAGRNADQTAGRRRLKRGLEVALVLLLIAVYGIYVYRLDERQEALQAEIAKLAKQAEAARAVTQRNAALQNALVLLEQRRKEPSPLALLNELTALTPSNTWVSQLTLQKRTIEIVGYSRRVSDFVPRINNSDSFWNFRFRSPIALSPDGRGERFDISFDVWVEDTP